MRRLATIAITLMAVILPTGPVLGRAQSPLLSAPRLQVTVEIDPRNVFIYRYTRKWRGEDLLPSRAMTVDISLPAALPGRRLSGSRTGRAISSPSCPRKEEP